MAVYQLPRSILEDTFALFRQCGRGRNECQALWLSKWISTEKITEVVHPKHRSGPHGFVLDDDWLNEFWMRLAKDSMGIRVQVHTHPFDAFHSQTDDDYPIIHTAGFLSLVIPNFALGAVDFKDAYLTEIQENGRWQQMPISERLALI